MTAALASTGTYDALTLRSRARILRADLKAGADAGTRRRSRHGRPANAKSR